MTKKYYLAPYLLGLFFYSSSLCATDTADTVVIDIVNGQYTVHGITYPSIQALEERWGMYATREQFVLAITAPRCTVTEQVKALKQWAVNAGFFSVTTATYGQDSDPKCHLKIPNFDSMKPLYLSFSSILTDGTSNYWVTYQDHPNTTVDSYFKLPDLESGYTFVKGQCHFKGRYMEAILALVKTPRDKPKWTEVSHAWIIHDNYHQLSTIDHTNVTCLNDGWGL